MRTILCLIACLAFAACGSDTEQAESQAGAETQALTESAEQAAPTVADMTVAAGSYKVACGCSVEGVGHCGNYIEVDSHFLEVANGEDMGLGKMEWCGKSDVTAQAAGAVKDGQFVAASLVVQ